MMRTQPPGSNNPPGLGHSRDGPATLAIYVADSRSPSTGEWTGNEKLPTERDPHSGSRIS
jgi:hypothetical protein